MATRSHRSVPKRDYRELADVTVPKRSIVSRPLSFTKSNGRSDDSSSKKLYRLRVIEADSERGHVKV